MAAVLLCLIPVIHLLTDPFRIKLHRLSAAINTIAAVFACFAVLAHQPSPSNGFAVALSDQLPVLLSCCSGLAIFIIVATYILKRKESGLALRQREEIQSGNPSTKEVRQEFYRATLRTEGCLKVSNINVLRALPTLLCQRALHDEEVPSPQLEMQLISDDGGDDCKGRIATYESRGNSSLIVNVNGRQRPCDDDESPPPPPPNSWKL